MKKLLLVVLIAACSAGVIWAQTNETVLFQSQDAAPLKAGQNSDISLKFEDLSKDKNITVEKRIAPIAETDGMRTMSGSEKSADSIYQYGNYVQDDLVGTSGNGIRDQLMVATPVDISYCKRPDSGTPTADLKEGILFVSSDVFRATMNTKSSPLNMFEFRNVFSPYSNTSIKNTVPYSNNYSYATPMYFIYYHSYLPTVMATTILATDGTNIAQLNSAQSYILGCYSLRYDGQISTPEYYWLSAHRTQIFKDTFFVLETLHHRNVIGNKEYNRLLHIVRQGTTTNWQPYIDQVLGQ